MLQLLRPLSMAALLFLSFLSGWCGTVRAENVAPPAVVPAVAFTSDSTIASPDDVTGRVSLAQAVALALRFHPEIAAAGHELEASDGSLQQAGLLPNPELAATVEDTQRRDTRTTTVQINQLLELGGKRDARITAAQRTRDLAAVDLAASRAQVRAAVVTAFYEVASAQERLRLAQVSAQLAVRASEIATKRVAAGKLSPVEETKAKVAEASTRIELAQAESALATARQQLAASWGARVARFERVEGGLQELPALPTDLSSLAAQLDASPSLAHARLEVERRQALVRLEQARRIPDVTVSLGAKRDEELGRTQAVVGLALPLPLFDRNQGHLREALSRADQARDELTAARVRLESELAAAYQRLLSARREAELFQQEILPGAQSAYDAATKGFAYGKFSFLEVLDAQRTFFQATTQALRASAEAHRASADIERLLGITAPASTK